MREDCYRERDWGREMRAGEKRERQGKTESEKKKKGLWGFRWVREVLGFTNSILIKKTLNCTCKLNK